MPKYLPLFNSLLGAATVIAQIFIIILLPLLISNQRSKVILLIKKQALAFGFIVALTATLGSLSYSEVIGFSPCRLCWYQRIFMYPQVILLGIALIKKEKLISIYSLVLAVIGAAISAYQYYGQMFITKPLFCNATSEVSCQLPFFVQFGYITIPLMALSAFLLIILLMIIAKLNISKIEQA